MFEREPHLHLHHVFAGFGPCFRPTRSWLFVIRTLFSPRFWVLNAVDFTMTASFDVMPPKITDLTTGVSRLASCFLCVKTSQPAEVFILNIFIGVMGELYVKVGK